MHGLSPDTAERNETDSLFHDVTLTTAKTAGTPTRGASRLAPISLADILSSRALATGRG